MGKTAAFNRKARRDFHLFETWEAGVVLKGTEVKSLRIGRANLQDSFAGLESGEVFLYNMHISPYEAGNRFNHDPKRTRKLLFHKAEIKRLVGKVAGSGLTLVPLKVYFKGGKAKVEIALARGKKKYDKREAIRKRDMHMEVQRTLAARNRGR